MKMLLSIMLSFFGVYLILLAVTSLVSSGDQLIEAWRRDVVAVGFGLYIFYNHIGQFFVFLDGIARDKEWPE